MESNKQSLIGNYVLDNRIRNTLSSAKITLCELNLTNRSLSWSADECFHFNDFSNSYDGTLEGYYQLIHEDDKERVNQAIKSLAFGRSISAEHRVLWPDGSYHWLEAIGRAYSEMGMIKLVGTVQDITERKRLENEKEDWETRHKLVAEAAGIIVYDYDISSSNIQWSGNVEDVTSFSPKEMSDIEKWGEFIHPDDRVEAYSLLEKAKKSLSTYELYYRFKKKGDEYCHMYDRGTFVFKNGIAVRMLGMMSDVSELVHSKAALVESEKLFRSLINNLNVGVALYDKNMIPRVHNKSAYSLLGLTEEQFTGRVAIHKDWNVLDGNGLEMKQENFPIPQAISTGLAIRQVVMGVNRPSLKDRVWLMVDAEPVYSEEHDLIQVICTYTDFTARRRMEEKLKENNKKLLITSSELRRRNERLLEFAQIVSHNLRSPLCNISDLSDLYIKGDESEKDEAVSYIKKICGKALNTIDDLNEILKVQQSERLESKKMEFEATLDSTMELIKNNLLERDVAIEKDFIAAPVIEYPEIFLESIFLNLISNAIKFTPLDKSPLINIKTFEQGKDLILIIKDQGIGLDLSKYKNDLFGFGKTFHQGNDSKGFGLFLVKNQLRTMGDTIEVESKVGEGTSFKITFKNQLNAE